jgi:hypothetical protein
MSAINTPSIAPCSAYSANSLTFSMATDVEVRVVGEGGVDACQSTVVVFEGGRALEMSRKLQGSGEQSGLAEKARKG